MSVKTRVKSQKEAREKDQAIGRLARCIQLRAKSLNKGCPDKVATALAHKVYRGDIESPRVAAVHHVLTANQLAARAVTVPFGMVMPNPRD